MLCPDIGKQNDHLKTFVGVSLVLHVSVILMILLKGGSFSGESLTETRSVHVRIINTSASRVDASPAAVAKANIKPDTAPKLYIEQEVNSKKVQKVSQSSNEAPYANSPMIAGAPVAPLTNVDTSPLSIEKFVSNRVSVKKLMNNISNFAEFDTNAEADKTTDRKSEEPDIIPEEIIHTKDKVSEQKNPDVSNKPDRDMEKIILKDDTSNDTQVDVMESHVPVRKLEHEIVRQTNKESVISAAEEKKESPSTENAGGILGMDLMKYLEDVLSETEETYTDASPSNKAVATKESNVDLTDSEKIGFKKQISKCWFPPIGVSQAERLVIILKVTLSEKGWLLSDPEHIVSSDNESLEKIAAYRVAVEEAKRAVISCQPYNMPFEKYSQWREIELVFDPVEMVFGR